VTNDFEKLGVFYLGRRFDLSKKALTNDLVLYDSSDLVTHALCVGMTGSGKTGLCIDLIEEAAIDGVPSIVIDPKGDLTNLLLTFPELKASDFAPWVDQDEARRAGKSPEAFAAEQAERWKKGLAEWGEDGARIQRLRDAAEFTIYTPGSSAGVPVSVLRSFAPPASTTGDQTELLNESAQTTTSALLTLAGIEADFKSREHVLVSNILLAAWSAGESLDLAAIVQRVQKPPMARIGVIDTDSFFPPKERFAFAMSVNALLAAPGFESWMSGDPLDAGAFLHTAAGKPRVSIFSIAHLDDGQRMFFVTLLLNAVVAWMRSQTGTSSLRALLYMDEIFGYFPPVANPPSKPPLLSLLKQARAFGVGVVLATQNPVDLDYRGLANIGTWWLGRLQTERDKTRLLDGLQSAAAGATFDRSAVDAALSGLPGRVFVMRNIHEDALETFQSRWALSYLRGPLGKEDIRRLSVPPRASSAPASQKVGDAPEKVSREGPSARSTAAPPVLPPGIPQFFAPGKIDQYKPVLYGAADVRFVDATCGVDVTRTVAATTAITDAAVPVEWDDAEHVDLLPSALVNAPSGAAAFSTIPAAASRAKNYDAWSKAFAVWIAGAESLDLFRRKSSGDTSKPGESERDFRARLQQAAREDRDKAVEALRRKYAPQLARLDEKIREANARVERESQQATSQKLQTAISFGATLVGAFLGRKAISATTLGRATTAARGVGRTIRESEDIHRAQESVEAIEQQRRDLDDQFKADTAALDASTDPLTEPLERISVKPKKTNVQVKLVALLWIAD